MRKTLIAGSALAVAALCGLSLIATRQEANDLRIPSGPQTIDASSLAKMKHKVPSSKGMMKVEGEDSPNVDMVKVNLWNSVDHIFEMSTGNILDKKSTLQFDNNGQYLYSGIKILDNGDYCFDWQAKSNICYTFSGTISGMQKEEIEACSIYMDGGEWRVATSTVIFLNEENNYTASFITPEMSYNDGTPLGVAFMCAGDGLCQITASEMNLGYEIEAVNACAWSIDSDLQGLGLNTSYYPDSVKYVASLADGISKLGVAIYEDKCIITGINTPQEVLKIPNVININGTLYIPDYFGKSLYSFFDWTGAPALKMLYLGPINNWEANMDGCVLTDIWSEVSNLYIDTYNNYDFSNVYLHMPFDAQRSDYNYYGFKRVLIGEETPDVPESQYANWVIHGDREGDYFGIIDNGSYYSVCEIFTDSTCVALPEIISTKSGEYYIDHFGSDYSYSNILCTNAPNLESITVPATYAYMNVCWNNYKIRELHIQGAMPVTNWSIPQTMTVYIGDRFAYSDFESSSAWNNAILLPEGWKFEWITVNVDRPGEFAQTYIEMTDADWTAGIYVKVTGTLNENDLKTIKNLELLRTLDLSEAIFDELPNGFLQSKMTLTDVILPKSLDEISNSAFNNCKKLKNVAAPGVTKIGSSAFYYCNNLESLDIKNVTRIGDSAFYYCKSYNPSLPEGLTYLGNSAFNSSGITEVIIPAGLKEISSRAFSHCRLTHVSIPETVRTIRTYAFDNSSLTEILIPEGVTSIESGAFENCTLLKTITLPSTLNNIDYNVFSDCSKLTTVVCKAIVPPVASSSFTNGMDMNHCTLYVAPFATQSYREADNWSAFYIMKPLNEPVKNIYINRPMIFDLLSEDNAVLQENPNMTLDYGDKTMVGQLSASGDGTLSAGVFKILHKFQNRDNYYSDYRTTLINNAENMRADSVLCSIDFEKNSWHFISFQYDVQMSDIFGLNNTDFVIRQYNGETRAAGDGTVKNWEPVAADGILKAGKGYIIQAANNTKNSYNNTNAAIVRFPSRNTVTKNNLFTSNNIIVPLEEYQAEFAHNRSWNLIGNPYPCYYDMHYLMDDFIAPVTLWNGSGYQAYSPVDDDIILRPNEAFFVQRPLDAEQMVFGSEGRLHYTEATSSERNNNHTPGVRTAPAKVNADRSVFNFNVKGETGENRARIVINEKASMAYETGCDAPKFFAEESADVEVYVNGDIRYDICERPLGDASALLGVKVAKRGEYTISLSGRAYEGWNVMLTDKVTGTTVDLTASAYSFDSEAGDFADRFAITFKAPAQTSVSEIEASEGNAPVRIVNLSGVTVYEGPVADFNASNGVYVVLGAQKAYKVILK